MLFAEGVTKTGERLGYADEHAADKRAVHGTEAADDHDHEGEQRVGRAERRA